MRVSVAIAFFLLAFTPSTKGARIPCESEDGQIGWCMNQYNPNDRADCPIEFWEEPIDDDECPDDRVSNPLDSTIDLF